MKRLTLLVFALGLSTQFATAQTTTKAKQIKQKERIEQGVKSGELTKKEAQKLKKGQKRIQQMKKKIKADGKITKKEKQRLKKAQKKQSDKIFKQKHDKQKRPKAKAKEKAKRKLKQIKPKVRKID